MVPEPEPTPPISSEQISPIVECDNVSKHYSRGGNGGLFSKSTSRPRVTALDSVELEVYSGEVVGIAGPSGSGKSTLLHLVAALEVPTSGTIRLQGKNPAELNKRERAALRLETIGIVFQRFHLLSSVSARANVELPLIERGVAKKSRRARSTELLERVGLGDRMMHLPGELSGGEQQRVAIARAIAVDPPLIVADEPTGELDSATGERILDLLGELAEDEHSVLLASHDLDALDRADRIIQLRDGQRIDTDA